MKTGDRVVCVDAYTKALIVNREYIVYDTVVCSGCKLHGIAIGVPFEAGIAKYICGTNAPTNILKEFYYSQHAFRKVEEKREYKVVKSNIKIEETILS